jgi:DNA-binding NtrC family response regulator
MAETRVLIVDDEPNIRLTFRAALESAGHRVFEAADGAAALATLGTTQADLIVLDLRMAPMDGMETLRRLREARIGVPVVMITAHGSVPDAVEAMRLGAIDFLPKPVTPEALRRIVVEVIERNETPGDPAPVTEERASKARSERALVAAKRAINRGHFEEAEDLLAQAAEDRPDDPEVRSLLDTLRKLRAQERAPYHTIGRLLY